MSAAGGYNDRLVWMRRTLDDPDEFGQKAELFPIVGNLWGVIEDVVASRVTEKSSEKQETRATIRLRNYPDVNPGDRLRDVFGNEWQVLTAITNDNEIEVDVKTPPTI